VIGGHMVTARLSPLGADQRFTRIRALTARVLPR